MIELFPAGFEERERRRRRSSSPPTPTARRRAARPGRARPGADAGGRGRLGGRVAAVSPARRGSARSGSARPGRRPTRRARRRRRPGRAFGTGAHPTTRLCLELLLGLEPTSLARPRLRLRGARRSRRRSSASRPSSRSTTTRPPSRRRGRTRPRTASTVDVAARRRARPTRLPRAEIAVANIAREPVGAARRAFPRDASSSRPATWRRSDQHRAGARPRARRDAGRQARSRDASSLAGRAGRTCARLSASIGSPWRRFTVGFLGCKVSQTDAQEIRERLVADGHVESAEARGRRRRQHVLRHARGGAQVAAGGAAGGPDRRARVRDGLRREPGRRRVRRPAGQRDRRPPPGRAHARVRRPRRRRHRLRPRRRRPRPGPGVREGPGRLQLLVRLLRHPAGPRRVPQPPGGRGARRGAAPGRAGSPRGRPHRHQPRLLPGPRGRATTSRGSSARSARRRGSSGCGSRRSR